MKSKYLNDDPVPWLLEDNIPSIKYLTMKDLLGKNTLQEEYGLIVGSQEIQSLLNNGLLGDIICYDLHYKGAMWAFCEGVERGLMCHTSFVAETIDAIAKQACMGSGGFTKNWRPRVEDARLTGDLTRNMIKSGYKKDMINRSVQWIIKHQRHDGGWLYKSLFSNLDIIKFMLFKKSGDGIAREHDRSVASSPAATLACASALVEYKKKYNDSSLDQIIKNACGFFLDNGQGIADVTYSKKWRMTQFPVFMENNIIDALLLLAEAGFSETPLFGRTFNLLLSKQNSNGTWDLEYRKNSIQRINANPDKWVTLKVLRLLQLLENT